MRKLARFLVECKGEAIPVQVRREASRMLLAWLGCAIGACRHESVNRALASLNGFGGSGQASVLGRSERLSLLHAALVNGMSSQVLDSSEAQTQTGGHGGASVAAATLALAEHCHVEGDRFLHAVVLGMEAECRVHYAVHRSHHDVGWHPSGSAGVLGAAAACGRLLALGEQQMTWALGIAATQGAASHGMLGARSKRFHPGHAAHSGITAALLARSGFTPWGRAPEARRGLAQAVVGLRNVDVSTRSLGLCWSFGSNPEPEYARPVTIRCDLDMDATFSDRVEPHLGSASTRRLVEVVRRIEELADAGDIARASTPALHWGMGVSPGACA